MQFKHLVLTAGLLLGSASIAAAAPALVTADLNLRSGPGTNYGVVNVLPGGSTVDVLSCSGSWCRVGWGNSVGFASRSYLDVAGGPVYAVAPPPIVVAPPVFGYGYAYRSGPRFHSGPRYYRGGNVRGPGPQYRGGSRPGPRAAAPGPRGTPGNLPLRHFR
ncbi:MAG: SH3 domain-containing protein [Pseudolabrys sp.]|nr:SH3 domain-containing protein [Pseudolabrys sp.]